MTRAQKLVLVVLTAIAGVLALQRFGRTSTPGNRIAKPAAVSSSAPAPEETSRRVQTQAADRALAELAALRVRENSSSRPSAPGDAPADNGEDHELVLEEPAPASPSAASNARELASVRKEANQSSQNPLPDLVLSAAASSQASSEKCPADDLVAKELLFKKRERELIDRLNGQEQQLIALSERIAEYERSGASKKSQESEKEAAAAKRESAALERENAAKTKAAALEQQLEKLSKEKKLAEDALAAKKADKTANKLLTQLEDLERRFRELKERDDLHSSRLQDETTAKMSLQTQVSTLQKKIEEAQRLRDERDELRAKADELAEKLRQSGKEKKELLDRAANADAQIKVFEEAKKHQAEEFKKLSDQLESSRKDYLASKDANIELKKQNQASERLISENNVALNRLKLQFEGRDKEATECSAQLDVAKQMNDKVKDLQSELLSAKNQLLLAQEQIRLLGGRAEQVPAAPRSIAPKVAAEAPVPAAPPAAGAPAASGEMIVEVVVDKANLREGPGDENSAVMQVPAGAKLLVESREGDWFRVIAPNGQRKYIRADVVQLQDAAGRLKRFPRPRQERPAASGEIGELVGAVPAEAPPPVKPDTADEEDAFEELRKGIGAKPKE